MQALIVCSPFKTGTITDTSGVASVRLDTCGTSSGPPFDHRSVDHLVLIHDPVHAVITPHVRASGLAHRRAPGGIPEQVRDLAAAGDHATGLLVPPEDPAALAGALARLLGDPALRDRLGARAAADARARFGLERQVDATLALYEDARRGHVR